jgi:hypothetical protein
MLTTHAESRWIVATGGHNGRVDDVRDVVGETWCVELADRHCTDIERFGRKIRSKMIFFPEPSSVRIATTTETASASSTSG